MLQADIFVAKNLLLVFILSKIRFTNTRFNINWISEQYLQIPYLIKKLRKSDDYHMKYSSNSFHDATWNSVIYFSC